MITVYGGGSWGTALAHLLASNGHSTMLLLRDAAVAAAINEGHENPRYLPGLSLNPGLRATTDVAVLAASDLWVLAIPCQSQRHTLAAVRELLGPQTGVINAAKGISLETLQPLSEVTRHALGLTCRNAQQRYAVLSGPSFAREILEGKPAATVLACANPAMGRRLQRLFAASHFRCYSCQDVRGVELGGALKNVIAIAAGVSDGLNYGDNARAALMTRGLAEISRLGRAMGARATTFMGLSGLGDLLLTCTGALSRNRQLGLRLGRGERLARIMADMRMVAEGVKTTHAVCALAQRLNVEMPIAAVMADLLENRLAPDMAAQCLLHREQGEELPCHGASLAFPDA